MNNIDVIYQGAPGAYSHEASKKFVDTIGMKGNFKNVTTFESVFNEVKKRVSEKLPTIGILPIENGYEGSVHENFKRLLDLGEDFQIIAEVFLKINHCLLGITNNFDDIKTVYSHPQALGQCREYLKCNNLEPLNCSNTASAARMVAENNDLTIASISSKFCAEFYGLNILDENIQDMTGNVTRFFLITIRDVFDEYLKNLNMCKSNKMSIKFETKNTPGALVDCLFIFKDRKINITKIESFPTRKENFKYVFWLDVEKEGINDEVVNDALNELGKVGREVMILGNY